MEQHLFMNNALIVKSFGICTMNGSGAAEGLAHHVARICEGTQSMNMKIEKRSDEMGVHMIGTMRIYFRADIRKVSTA